MAHGNFDVVRSVTYRDGQRENEDEDHEEQEIVADPDGCRIGSLGVRCFQQRAGAHQPRHLPPPTNPTAPTPQSSSDVQPPSNGPDGVDARAGHHDAVRTAPATARGPFHDDTGAVVMSLSLVFLLLGAALVAGASVTVSRSGSLAVRSISAAALAAGGLMLLIGLVNGLSGTM